MPKPEWDIDLPALYGTLGWRRRSRFHLGERLYESPDRSCAILLFHIGEVGINKQVAAAALLRDKGSPRLAWNSSWTRFWFEGGPAEPVVFSQDGRKAVLYEFIQRWSGRMDWRERILDLATESLEPFSDRPRS